MLGIDDGGGIRFGMPDGDTLAVAMPVLEAMVVAVVGICVCAVESAGLNAHSRGRRRSRFIVVEDPFHLAAG
jgi:hypothetical protein